MEKGEKEVGWGRRDKKMQNTKSAMEIKNFASRQEI
jgi:hypothetical protein